MKPTPKREGREPLPGSRFLTDVVAENVRVLRSLRQFSQSTLAAIMAYLGHDWSRATVSDVERAERNVTMDELLALALALGATIPDLLDPAGVDGRGTNALDYGRTVAMPSRTARHVLHGRVVFRLMNVEGAVADECYEIQSVSGDEQAFAEAVEDEQAMARERRQRYVETTKPRRSTPTQAKKGTL